VRNQALFNSVERCQFTKNVRQNIKIEKEGYHWDTISRQAKSDKRRLMLACLRKNQYKLERCNVKLFGG